MRFFVGFSFILGLLIATACSHDGSSSQDPSNNSQSDQKPWAGEIANGQINGKAWVFKGGRSYIFAKKGQKYLIVQLWSDAFADPCNERVGSVLQVRITAPMELNSWQVAMDDPFNANLSIFFADLDFNPHPRDNMRADEGQITLANFDDAKVNGYFKGSFQNPKVGGTQVQGAFSVPLCQGKISDGSFRDNFSFE